MKHLILVSVATIIFASAQVLNASEHDDAEWTNIIQAEANDTPIVTLSGLINITSTSPKNMFTHLDDRTTATKALGDLTQTPSVYPEAVPLLSGNPIPPLPNSSLVTTPSPQQPPSSITALSTSQPPAIHQKKDFIDTAIDILLCCCLKQSHID